MSNQDFVAGRAARRPLTSWTCGCSGSLGERGGPSNQTVETIDDEKRSVRIISIHRLIVTPSIARSIRCGEAGEQRACREPRVPCWRCRSRGGNVAEDCSSRRALTSHARSMREWRVRRHGANSPTGTTSHRDIVLPRSQPFDGRRSVRKVIAFDRDLYPQISDGHFRPLADTSTKTTATATSTTGVFFWIYVLTK